MASDDTSKIMHELGRLAGLITGVAQNQQDMRRETRDDIGHLHKRISNSHKDLNAKLDGCTVKVAENRAASAARKTLIFGGLPLLGASLNHIIAWVQKTLGHGGGGTAP